MHLNLKRMTAGLVFAAMLGGCAGPGIGLNTDFRAANFQVNQTTKKEVIDRLGLPQKILKDQQGQEHFIYEGATRLVGACIGCGIVNAPVGAIPSLINESGVKNGAEYVFDAKNVLVFKVEPQS